MTASSRTRGWHWVDWTTPVRPTIRLVLCKEVSRLPENDRGAVQLCYLEERSNGEAAALLRWPMGTIKTRLARARALLRARLARHA